MSYHHIEWLPITQVESAHLGKHRVKKFLSKYQADGEKGEDYAEYLKVSSIGRNIVSMNLQNLTYDPS
jgi:hypothetical protein